MDSGTVEEILLVEAQKTGLEISDLNFANGVSKNVRGYIVSDNGSPDKIFNDLGVLYNIAFAETADGKLTIIDKSVRSSVAEIKAIDLSAHSADSDESARMK